MVEGVVSKGKNKRKAASVEANRHIYGCEWQTCQRQKRIVQGVVRKWRGERNIVEGNKSRERKEKQSLSKG